MQQALPQPYEPRATWNDEGACSEAADAALDILAIVKAAKADLDFIAPGAFEHTSKAIGERWSYLSMWIDAIDKRADKYAEIIRMRQKKQLEENLRPLDEVNIRIRSEDRNRDIAALRECIDEYAGVIVSELRSNMDDRARHLFDLNR